MEATEADRSAKVPHVCFADWHRRLFVWFCCCKQLPKSIQFFCACKQECAHNARLVETVRQGSVLKVFGQEELRKDIHGQADIELEPCDNLLPLLLCWLSVLSLVLLISTFGLLTVRFEPKHVAHQGKIVYACTCVCT